MHSYYPETKSTCNLQGVNAWKLDKDIIEHIYYLLTFTKQWCYHFSFSFFKFNWWEEERKKNKALIGILFSYFHFNFNKKKSFIIKRWDSIDWRVLPDVQDDRGVMLDSVASGDIHNGGIAWPLYIPVARASCCSGSWL